MFYQNWLSTAWMMLALVCATDLAGGEKPQIPGAGKKGLQVQMLDDALKLGIQHAALNVSITSLIDLNGRPDSFVWQSAGETYHFNRPAVEGIPVKPLSDAGIQVNLILLAMVTNDPKLNEVVRPPSCTTAPNGITGFNLQTPLGRRHFRACIEFLADRFSRHDAKFGRASGYIVGNEVNSHWHWYNIGEASVDQIAEEYVQALQITSESVRKSSTDARVYASFEHHWNRIYGKNPLQTCKGRDLLDRLCLLSKARGDFEWHIAFHPYPENLFEPRSWLDRTALHSPDTPRITFKNLEQLGRYLERPELQCRGRQRRVILSEQGFNSPNKPDGQLQQAAGFCYGWMKVSQADFIDAFILHRHVDHGQEGGLNLGLWSRRPGSIADPQDQKLIYAAFRAAGTSEWESAFRFALPVIGISNWGELNSIPEPPKKAPQPAGENSNKFPRKVTAAGLHNVYQLAPQIYSGSSPEGDVGFQSLEKLGIRTVVSVDGALPDLKSALQHKLKYVHLPVGYDGISRETIVKLAHVAKTYPTPIYVHCHHGKHRGPAAAVALQMCTDTKCTAAMALASMQTAGTDPHYTGLYDVPRQLRIPTATELAPLTGPLPEQAEVPQLVQMMTNVDSHWEELSKLLTDPKQVAYPQAAAKALLLAEQFRESLRLTECRQKGKPFLEDLQAAAQQAETLMTILKQSPPPSKETIDMSLKAFKGTCTRCHHRDRDVK